ncbi:MAG: polysaccharide pyruvyl transferase CsaB [Pelotomaculum sp.]|jgi:polysaccharide pyruvyl transferase CsaB
MPRVVISGYYGFHNIGDEAMLHAMLQALREAVPGLEAAVLSRDPAYTARQFGVESIPRDDLGQIVRALRKAELFISGGGGLLQDVTGPKSVVYYLGLVALARLLGKPVFFYAQGFGPVNTPLGKKLVKLIANRVDAITVRDPDSRAELVALGVNRPPIEVTADPVLGLDPGLVDLARGRTILAGLGLGDAPVAGISVRPWKNAGDYLGVLARVADDLVAAGWQVLLVPMHQPVDLVCCREVAARMKARAFIFEEPADYMDILSLTAGLDLAIGMRLHFLIFSSLFGVPPVGITYDPKVNRFLQSLGLPPGLKVEDLDYQALSARLQDILDRREQVKAQLKERLAPLQKEAQKNAALAAELLVATATSNR